MAGNLSRAGYVGPTLNALICEVCPDQPLPPGPDSVAAWAVVRVAVRVAQELIVRRQAASDYARREGATDLVRVQLERDELRAQIVDFIAGVLP